MILCIYIYIYIYREREIIYIYIYVYIYIYIYAYTHIVFFQREPRGSQGMAVVSNNWFDRALLPILHMLKHPHVDRCSDPLPRAPLSCP